MSPRSFITILLAITCAAAIWRVVAQGNQLSGLRAEQKHLEAANPETNSGAIELAPTLSTTPEVPRELLQLRAEVARLSQQQRELASARSENERLRLQVENRRTNSAAAKGVGGGYVKTSEAKWLGYSRPADTLQSFLWAKKNHDLGKFMEALTPEAANQVKEMLQNGYRTPDQLFGDKELPPTYRIGERREQGTDYIEVEVQIAPDIPGDFFLFQQIGGQWKLKSPH
jgi:hypothetical protein